MEDNLKSKYQIKNKICDLLDEYEYIVRKETKTKEEKEIEISKLTNEVYDHINRTNALILVKSKLPFLMKLIYRRTISIEGFGIECNGIIFVNFHLNDKWTEKFRVDFKVCEIQKILEL